MMTNHSDLEDVNEEFNNFMYRVNNINDIVKKLASQDTKLQEIGNLEAEQYLKSNSLAEDDTIMVDDIKVHVKSNRSLINKKALRDDDKNNENEMSQEAFMAEVSKDADMRYKDKLIRQEKADTLKTRANKAFRRGEFELALSLYGKAIEHIKDSPQLYINKALAQINLERYEQAIEDIETALKFNENSLKAHMLLAKCYYLMGKHRLFKETVQEAKNRNVKQVHFIDEYVEEMMTSKDSEKQIDFS